MSEITVQLGGRSYPLIIGSGVLDQLGRRLARLNSGKTVLLVTDANVAALYSRQVQQILTGAGFQVTEAVIPGGEESKSLDQAAWLYDRAFTAGLDRQCPVIALGGGVVGDLAGFVAATYMRGVPFIQVPTTLLAQVDSSVGGKVAVNHPRGKNIIGAFYQPRLVLADTDTLPTLDRRNLQAGLAEVIKYGVIWDESFFAWLEQHIDAALAMEADVLAAIIEQCCTIKAAVVAQDETEQGVRAILNYGHTVGHALEAISHYERYLHGEAVAIGMAAAARLAQGQGLLSEAQSRRIERLIAAAGLPAAVPQEYAAGDLIKLMYQDKKVCNHKLTLVLPTTIGAVQIDRDFPEQQLYTMIK